MESQKQNQETNETIHPLWLKEIDRRIKDEEEGRVTMIPYKEFRDQFGKKG